MSEVKKYKEVFDHNHAQECICHRGPMDRGVEECEDGDYVSVDDYNTLKKKNDDLEEKLSLLQEENEKINDRLKEPQGLQEMVSVEFMKSMPLTEIHRAHQELHINNEELQNKVDELQKKLDDTCLSFTKAIEFSIEGSVDGGLDFLRCWLEGDWDGCREWGEDFDLHPMIFYPETTSA